MRWIDGIKEVMALSSEELIKAIKNKIFLSTLIHRVTMGQKQLDST